MEEEIKYEVETLYVILEIKRNKYYTDTYCGTNGFTGFIEEAKIFYKYQNALSCIEEYLYRFADSDEMDNIYQIVEIIKRKK